MPVRFRIDQIRRLYPQLMGLDLSFRELGEGVPEEGKEATLSLKESNLVGRLPCANPGCVKGGYELTDPMYGPLEQKAESSTFEAACVGYLGHVRSEAEKRRCPNRIEGSIGLLWKPG